MNDGNRPLHIAAAQGYWKILQTLLEHGADPAAENGAGQNALHVACAHGQTNAVKVLLNSKKVSPNSRSQNGNFPVHFAVEAGEPEVVKGTSTTKST